MISFFQNNFDKHFQHVACHLEKNVSCHLKQQIRRSKYIDLSKDSINNEYILNLRVRLWNFVNK